MAGYATSPRVTVGHFLRAYLPLTETFIYTLLRHLSEAKPVVVAGWTENREHFPFAPIVETYTSSMPLGEQVVRRVVANLNRYPNAHLHRLTRALSGHRCSVIHAHHGPSGWMTLAAKERLGLPVLTTFYGRDINQAAREPEWIPHYEHLFQVGDLFAVEGSAMADLLAGVGAPRERIRIVRIGLELRLFPFEPRMRKRPLTFVQPARFMEKKGIDVSIKAFAKALPDMGDSELWLVGDGPLRPALEQLARDLGVAPHVRFLGEVSHGELKAIMARAHAGVHPSRTARDGDTEGGAPTTLLEMQAMGLPVVATRHADIPEVVPERQELPEPDDVDAVAQSMARLADLPDADWRERCEAGRALMEDQHDVRRTAASVEAIYRELAGV